MSKCTQCHCDCHCNKELHVPTDTLDTGGLCVCEECICTDVSKEDGIPHYEH